MLTPRLNDHVLLSETENGLLLLGPCSKPCSLAYYPQRCSLTTTLLTASHPGHLYRYGSKGASRRLEMHLDTIPGVGCECCRAHVQASPARIDVLTSNISLTSYASDGPQVAPRYGPPADYPHLESLISTVTVVAVILAVIFRIFLYLYPLTESDDSKA